MELKDATPKLWDRVKSAGRILFGYDAVKNTRYRKNRGMFPLRGEDVELPAWDRDRLISTLMDFKRNDPVVKAISRLKKTDIVGQGIRPQPATNSDDLNEQLSEHWNYFAVVPEVTGTMDMTGLQQELADAPLFWGDIGVLLTRSGKLQLIEGDRIGSEGNNFNQSEVDRNKNGVIVTKNGRPIAYQVGERINGTLQNVRRIPARDFLLYYKRMRPQQSRGVPELASCVNALQDVSEYEATEMIAAKVAASLSAVIKKQDVAQFELVNRMPSDEQDDIGRLERFEPGNFHYLEPGEDVATISANGRPNVDGIDFVMYHLRKVGAAVGIPVEMIMSTIGETSFSASQGLLLQYQSSIEENQRHLAYFLDKIYRWKVANWIADGTIKIPPKASDPYQVRWQTPAFRWVNKAAQVKADISYCQLGAQSLDDIASQFGYTAESVMRRKAQNILQAQSLADEYGLDNWRELFNPYPTVLEGAFDTLLGQETEEGGTNPQG